MAEEYTGKLVELALQPEIGRDLCRAKRDEAYGGYKRDTLIENLTEREMTVLICKICRGIMKEACLSSSGEQFCSCCVKRDSYSQQNPNVSVREMINSLKCSCPLSERGCKWLGTLENCEDHLETCGYVYETCECGVVLGRGEHETHQDKCPQRVVQCDDCKKDFKSCEMNEHLDMCPKMEVSCDLKCGTVMCREYMKQHLEYDCGKGEETCILGCEEKITRDELKIHMKDTCAQRKIACEHCNKSIKFCDSSKHLTECPKVKVPCDLCCAERLRMDMTEHINDYCLEKMTDCPFFKYKCLARMKRKDIDKHLKEKETMHLGLKLTAMEELITEQSKELNTQKHEITKQSEELNKQKKEIIKQSEEISKQTELLYSITDTIKFIWIIEDATNPVKAYHSFESEIHQLAGHTFRFQVRQNVLRVVFPETTSKYDRPFTAKPTIVISSKQIKCDKVEVKQKDLTRGCDRIITIISKEDIERYSKPISPCDTKKDLTLEVYLTML